MRPGRLPRVDSAPRWEAPASGSVGHEDLLVRWTPAAPALPNRLIAMVDNEPFVAMAPGETSRPIETLLPPNRNLGPGSHRLVLCWMRDGLVARCRDGIPACDVRFFAVAKADRAAPDGMVALLPHGTYSGPTRAQSIAVELLGTGTVESGHYVEVQIHGVGGRSLRRVVGLGPTYLLENLASGDYTLDMQLHDSRGRPVQGPWSRVVRIITVNADVEDETSPVAPAASTAPSDR